MVVVSSLVTVKVALPDEVAYTGSLLSVKAAASVYGPAASPGVIEQLATPEPLVVPVHVSLPFSVNVSCFPAIGFATSSRSVAETVAASL